MEYKVNDFLNEINEIAPPPAKEVKEEDWKQCFDKLTGYPYYWNKKTDEVTWTVPPGFKAEKPPPKPQKKPPSSLPSKAPQPKSLYVPKGPSMLLGATSNIVPKESVKVYSVAEATKVKKRPQVTKKEPQKRHYPKDQSDDEKIVLISSYGSGSDSEEEPPVAKKNKVETTRSGDSENSVSDDDDDLDILAIIQKRAQELKELGGDIPAEVKSVVENSKIEISSPQKSKELPIGPSLPQQSKKNTSLPNKSKVTAKGPSLVASYYSDSDSDEENEEIKNIPQVKRELPVAHSTLFPVTTPVNVTDFVTPKPEVSTVVTSVNNTEPFDSKLFKRKKKLSVPVMTVVKKSDDNEERRTGFGFEESIGVSEKQNDNLYPGFKKGGVAFVKSDVLLPSFTKSDDSNNKDEDNSIQKEEIDNVYGNLKDKLTFLSEGRPPVSTVQVMVVQAETLVAAMNDGALKRSYLKKWLDDTCSELKKLEKEAAPTGWMLQWDRTHSRYFYQNKISGTSQWEYPQPDMNTSDVAMDISTTPPPPHEIEPPPPEEELLSPSPPPPPIISCAELEEDIHAIPEPVPVPVAIPVQIQPTPVPLLTYNGQPHPPGVDLNEITTETTEQPDLDSALDSFYSDIASITSTTQPPPPQEEECMSPAEVPTETIKKKKKSKLKLAQGLSMKKKGVSQLVEKWKHVQQEYKN